MRGIKLGLGRNGKARQLPRLSVVIPVFNMEHYLAECLDSVLAQSYADFEAIIVDDGSNDGSVEITEHYALNDCRFRVLRQENSGLGAARNAGVRAARGDFLTFLDSDDVLPTEAYAALMGTIERTGSDMVVGTLKRDDGRQQIAMRLMRENHRVRRERITLADMPLILADVFAVNKVYRRSFWDRAELHFPEGLRYEDQPTLTRAFVEAKRFDVIRETVYFWRVRCDNTSITQRRHEYADLVDRLESKRMSTAVVREACPPKVVEVWFRDILPVDMWEYFTAVPGCTDDYWATLRAAMAEFWSESTMSFERARIPGRELLMGRLVRHGRRRELERLIGLIAAHNGKIVVEPRGEDLVVLPRGAVDLDLGELEWAYTVDGRERHHVGDAPLVAQHSGHALHSDAR